MKTFLIISLLAISFSWSYGQKERSYNRKGVKDYMANDFSNAELDFRKALEVDSTSFEANYNTASNLYKLENYADANAILAKIADNIESPEHLPDLLHNLGNSFMKQEMYDKSIEAYKNALRIRPEDDETRYNLSYAQAKLKQQEQEQEQNKDQQDQDQQDQDQQNQDQQNQDQQDQEQQDQEQQDQDQDQEQNPEEQPAENKELSKEDVERILQAIQQQEKEVKEKVDKEKAKVKKVKTEKDW